MKIACPECHKPIPPAQLNVATDVALCGQVFAISALVAAGQDLGNFDLHQPPRGAWFDDTGVGWRVGASTRSPIAFFLVPFMCVWSGFSLGGIYASQIVSGEFSLLLSLFGIPFVLGTLLFGSVAVMAVCGQVVVQVDREEGRIFTGVGPFGWTRRFYWNDIHAVDEGVTHHRHAGNSHQAIALVGQRRITFGSMLSDARRYYVLCALRRQLSLRR
jgi:hypothetical protein